MAKKKAAHRGRLLCEMQNVELSNRKILPKGSLRDSPFRLWMTFFTPQSPPAFAHWGYGVARPVTYTSITTGNIIGRFSVLVNKYCPT